MLEENGKMICRIKPLSLFMRRKPVTKLLILGGVLFVSAAYFAFVTLLNVESIDKSSGRRLRLSGLRDAGGRLAAQSTGNRTLKWKYSNPLDVPRVAEYCNTPTTVELGEEGNSPDGYDLKSVYILIRHGDRTPITSYLDVPRPSPKHGCTMNATFLQSIPDLSNFLSDMDEQKNKQPPRSEFANWALYPQHKECSSSQLTGTGALQHLLNGLALKEKYIEQWDLFHPHFSPADQLDIRSTLISRTYQSAMALLYAFLPRFDLSELDVRVSKNSMFCSSNVPPACCSNLNKLKQEADKGRHKRGRKNPAWVPAMGALADVFGLKISQLPWATSLVDMLQGHACHGLPLPCGPDGKCITPDMMDKLWKLVVSDTQSYNKDPRFDRYSRTIIHSLLLDILASMDKVIRNASPVRFTLFSGHDLTVSPLLQAFDVHNGMWPRYATRVVFELYEKDNSNGQHYLRVLHNGKDITAGVRFCRGRTEQGMCHVKYFQDFVIKDNMEVMGVQDRTSMEAWCKSKMQ
ncbi:2-phosphoxylose phosphatase 1-like [Littorina saxatilis]|uniref:2-phosphoxylose phosphatase 1 n=1 Tax=Littorina saxatilis TaxID=31220 RepID=A0AAN9AW69_9CAEN